MKKSLLIFWVLILFSSSPSFAQHLITGKIVDEKTGEPLPSAHVIIKDSYKGTITNEDGEYQILVDEFPITLMVRFLGYESQEILVNSMNSGPVDFLLKESVAEMGEIVVTGEDPAITIMKEVIKRKQERRKHLQTYRAEAYTRQQLKNDTSIVSISETISEIFWDKELGPREVLKSRRQTANIEAASNFAGVSYMPNFYDDNLDIAGFDVVGVTHPKALSYYNFELVDMHSLNNQVVYQIEATSRRKLQPLFEGDLFVLGEEYALLEVNLKPNSVITFPAPVQDFDLRYRQQFSNFGGDFWLPVDVHIEGLVEVGIIGLQFPPIGFSQVAKISYYQVNVDLPDSLYKIQRTFVVDSTTINAGDSLFISEIDVIPLNDKEVDAYETVDSTATLEKAFQPTGFLAKMLDLDSDDESEYTISSDGGSSAKDTSNSSSKERSFFSKHLFKLKPRAHFNRVDAFYGELSYENRYFNNDFLARLLAGYSTGYNEFSYGVDFVWHPLNTHRFSTKLSYQAKTETRYESDLFDPLTSSISVLLGYDDYFDYYRNEGIHAGITYRAKALRNANVSLTYKYEEHSPLYKETNYNILGRNSIQRPNSYIEIGSLSAFEFKVKKGEDKKALGAIGSNDIIISVEQSHKLIGSSWNYTRFKLDLYRRLETFYQRRFFPNTLDLRLAAGTYLGDLPIQKNGILDAAPGIFTPFGAFRSKRFTPYEGASYLGLNAEHNFKSIPFEMFGWRDASKTGISFIVFGGIGKTWVKDEQVNRFKNMYGFTPSTTDGIHAEAGISISNIFDILRFDVAYRIDTPGIFFGVSMARFL